MKEGVGEAGRECAFIFSHLAIITSLQNSLTVRVMMELEVHKW